MGSSRKTDFIGLAQDKTHLIKSLNVSNAEALESRVRRELEEQGILDANDAAAGGENAVVENDEILEELRRCQSELKAVSAHNLGQLRRLLKVSESVPKNYSWIAQPVVVVTNRTLILKVGQKFKTSNGS